MTAPSHAAPITARAWAQLAVVTLIWSLTWTVIRGQLGVVPPAWSVAYRFVLAAVLIIGWCLATRHTLRVDRRVHLLALVAGFCQFVLNFNFVYQAERYVTSGVVAVVFALLLVPNAVLARIFLKHPIKPRFAIGSALGIAGVAMLFWHELGMAAHSRTVLWGLSLTVAAVVSASVGNVAQATEVARRLPVRSLLAVMLGYGATINVAVAWATSGPPVILVTPAYLGGILFLGGLASALAFNLYYDAIRAIGPGRAAYSNLVVPFVAMALSTALEGYRWTPIAIGGSVLALAGIYVALSSRRT